MPGLAELPERLDAVLRVVYLVFNEGDAASSGESVTRGRHTPGRRRIAGALTSLHTGASTTHPTTERRPHEQRTAQEAA